MLGIKRQAPTPGATDVCRGCGGKLIAHCGDILAWHWEHAAGADCDTWHEPETPWHIEWKQHAVIADRDCAEFVRDNHRADLFIDLLGAVEFQHSHLSKADMAQRNKFWGGCLWVFDAREPYRKCRFCTRPNKKVEDASVFWWKWGRTSISALTTPRGYIHDGTKVYLDLGTRVFKIFSFHADHGIHGSGQFIDKPVFIRKLQLVARMAARDCLTDGILETFNI